MFCYMPTSVAMYVVGPRKGSRRATLATYVCARLSPSVGSYRSHTCGGQRTRWHGGVV